ncbi:Cog5p [Sugiyamaella lignohabitans]|uniref:Conserved oligomeric Golgi complex subunit 5 n=1 Tax=Sugiyamaella lignohabitans TaxID=796027 RepID=A0A161HKW3_9ASCO|nr:Cog5p [Sugiyamaella lignohabitans]ANB12528.1 Cog5p [Sugiyamaella lignohabitans]
MSKEESGYEVFLDPGFSPVAYANSLVLATNTPTDPDVDLSAASRRLGYEMDEVDQLMSAISTENYEDLLDQARNVKKAEGALKSLKTSLDHVNFSYSKLERDVVKPYEQAQQMHTALKRLHLTSSMLRSLTWYLYLARQLTSLMSDSSAESNYKAVLNIQELRRQLESNPSLKSLQIIRAHENSLNWIQDNLKTQCLHRIRTFTLLQDKSDLGASFKAVYLLDPSSLITAISTYLRGQVTSTVSNFSKSLSRSVAGMEGASSDARNRARSLVAISSVLESATVTEPSTASSSPSKDTILLPYVKKHLDITTLVSSYWRDVASGLDAKVRDFTTRNPATAQAWAPHSSRLQDIIRSSVINGGGIDRNGLEVKVMLNAVAPLGR